MNTDEEQCLPWNPVPPAANRYMVLNVVSFAQMALGIVGGPLSLVVISSFPDVASQRQPPMTWRITFEYVSAFRCTEDERWHGPCPYDEATNNLTIATWEIAHSRWLKETIAPGHTAQTTPRHFVIASSFHFYDIAAAQWKVVYLPEQARVRAQLVERWYEENGRPEPRARRAKATK